MSKAAENPETPINEQLKLEIERGIESGISDRTVEQIMRDVEKRLGIV